MTHDNLIKTAAFKYAKLGNSFTDNLLKGTAVGLGIISASALANKVSDIISDYFHERKSAAFFEKMLEAHPSLKSEDPEVLAKYWASLYHFAPHMAEDPLASGAYIKQSIARLSAEQFGGPPPETFSTLSDIQKKHIEAQRTYSRNPRLDVLEGALISKSIDF